METTYREAYDKANELLQQPLRDFLISNNYLENYLDFCASERDWYDEENAEEMINDFRGMELGDYDEKIMDKYYQQFISK